MPISYSIFYLVCTLRMLSIEKDHKRNYNIGSLIDVVPFWSDLDSFCCISAHLGILHHQQLHAHSLCSTVGRMPLNTLCTLGNSLLKHVVLFKLFSAEQ